ncbi:MAG: acyltransferase [Pseudomonadota bacterium]
MRDIDIRGAATKRPEAKGSFVKLDGLQAGRAVAALLVVAFHANIFILPDRFYDGARAGRIFDFGYAGVEFFFVLSGFIMVFVHRRDFSVPARAFVFLKKRVFRIYPVYWVIYLSLTALYFIDHSRGPENARDPLAILASLLLWPMPDPPILQVAWTLQYEMLFYFVFTLLVLNLRVGAVVFAAWMAGCLVTDLWLDPSYPWGFLFSAYNLLFAFGIASAFAYTHLSIGQARGLLVLGSIAFLAVGASETFGLVSWNMPVRTWCYGLGASMAVAGLAAGAVSPPRWLSFLGDASYAIYLVHLPAMTVGAVVAQALGAPWGLGPLAMMGVLLVYSCVVGSIVHLWVERPLARMLSGATRARGR